MFRSLLVSCCAPAIILTFRESPAPHPPVCADGVRIYDSVKDVPTPYDSVTVPPPPAPVVVTNENEAAAAHQALKGRAGAAGATGVIISVREEDDGTGRITAQRTVQGVFVPSDSARAQQACRK